MSIVDALCNATKLDPADIEAVATRHPRARGVAALRAVLPFVDGGAESPRESITRLLLVDSGFPQPTTQLVVTDSDGGFIARCDMGWPEWRVIVEYDGADHLDKARHAADVDRYAQIEDAGWTVVVVTAKLLDKFPGVIVGRVGKKLRAAGAPV